MVVRPRGPRVRSRVRSHLKRSAARGRVRRATSTGVFAPATLTQLDLPQPTHPDVVPWRRDR